MTLTIIQEKVLAAVNAAGRDSNDVTLIAVSKVQPNERVQAVLDAGHRIYGENRVQEAAGKWPDFRKQYNGIDLHLLGPLQTNKARQAMDLFQTLHSLDRLKLAKTLARLAQEDGRCPDLFVQVNTGDEDQKAGIAAADVDTFVKECRSMDLPVVGLMCIPPVDDAAEVHFKMLADMAERNGLSGLSMGMSADFEVAISYGATHIRVGSAIFGDRVKPQ